MVRAKEDGGQESTPSYSKTLQTLRNVGANQILTVREKTAP